MRSRHHFPMSLVAGAACLPVLETPVGPLAVVAYAGFVGTAVDLDHFLIARYRSGSWAPLRRAASSPRVAFLDQDEIFEDGDVGPGERLLSHAVLTGLLVGGLIGVSPPMAAVTGVVLVVHVVADVAWDRSRERSGSGGGEPG